MTGKLNPHKGHEENTTITNEQLKEITNKIG